jgi:hypothetical protein
MVTPHPPQNFSGDGSRNMFFVVYQVNAAFCIPRVCQSKTSNVQVLLSLYNLEICYLLFMQKYNNLFGYALSLARISLFAQQATSIAIHMVKDWGMSEKVGLRTHDGNNSGLVVVNDLSPSTSDLIDAEIKRILTVSRSLSIGAILLCFFYALNNTSCL